MKLRVVGEHFATEVVAPATVMLKAKYVPNDLAEHLHLFLDPSALSANCHAQSDKARAVAFRFERLVECEEDDPGASVTKWLWKKLQWSVPWNLRFLVLDASSSAHQALARMVDIVLGQLGWTGSLSRIDAGSELERVTGKDAALVLAPVISSGNSLLRCNRDLRLNGHEGNRIFLAPLAFPATSGLAKTLQNSLVYGPGGLRYGYLNLLTVSVGDSLHSSWERELDVLESLGGTLFRARKKQLSNLSEGLVEDIALCNSVGEEPHRLTMDFAFWGGKKYNSATVSPVAVYLTVAAVLQSQRELDPNVNDDSLAARLHRPVVLDPNNFVRFNDPIIQSCIWRAAKDGELDYRRSEENSEIIFQVLRRSHQDLENGRPSAILDLLLAVRIGRLSLSEQQIGRLRALVKNGQLAGTAQKLLGSA